VVVVVVVVVVVTVELDSALENVVEHLTLDSILAYSYGLTYKSIVCGSFMCWCSSLMLQRCTVTHLNL